MTVIINTRPQERAINLTTHLDRYGYHVIEMPLLQLEPLALDEQLIAQFSAMAQVDLIVAVSSAAVEIGIGYYQKLGLALSVLQTKTWLAIGRHTQKTLAHYGITAICPRVESSEGALQLPMLQHYSRRSVAFWRGIGGRTILMQHLADQHCHIMNMELYRRSAASHSSAVMTQIKQLASRDELCWVIISSEFSWNQWCKLMLNQDGFNHQAQTSSNHRTQSNWQPMQSYGYLVLGERITALVRHYFDRMDDVPPIIQLQDLQASHIHQSIVNRSTNQN